MTIIRCDHCNTPIMEVKGRTITVKAKHHGKQHVTVVRIEDLDEHLREVAMSYALSQKILKLEAMPIPDALQAIETYATTGIDITHQILEEVSGTRHLIVTHWERRADREAMEARFAPTPPAPLPFDMSREAVILATRHPDLNR